MSRALRMLLTVLALASVPACGVRGLKEQIAAQDKEIADLRSLNDTLARQVTESRAEAERLRAGQGTPPTATAPGRLPRASERDVGPTMQALETRQAALQAALSPWGVTVSLRGYRLVISTPVSFESGKAVLAREGKAQLARIGRELRKYGSQFDIGVAGHTDATRIAKAATKRAFPTNWHLSGFRALAAMLYLVETTKLPPKQFHFSGYGEHHPVAKNTTPKGRAANRRIEIILTPAG